MTSGPVQTIFEVYQDFMYYTSGIYSHKSGSLMGEHTVEIVGWGQEDSVDYWIAKNSWGDTWGEDGFFRIKFGEVKFDSNAMAGPANTDSI